MPEPVTPANIRQHDAKKDGRKRKVDAIPHKRFQGEMRPVIDAPGVYGRTYSGRTKEVAATIKIL